MIPMGGETGNTNAEYSGGWTRKQGVGSFTIAASNEGGSPEGELHCSHEEREMVIAVRMKEKARACHYTKRKIGKFGRNKGL